MVSISGGYQGNFNPYPNLYHNITLTLSLQLPNNAYILVPKLSSIKSSLSLNQDVTVNFKKLSVIAIDSKSDMTYIIVYTHLFSAVGMRHSENPP